MRESFMTTFMSADVTASPERAWRALSDASDAATLVAGVRIVSDWKTGSTVRLDAAGFCVFGEVLRSAPPHRLTYTLGAPQPDGLDPTLVVTWEVRPGPDGGCVVALAVDDLAPGCEDHELQAAWRAALDALVRHVDGAAAVLGPSPTT